MHVINVPHPPYLVYFNVFKIDNLLFTSYTGHNFFNIDNVSDS